MLNLMASRHRTRQHKLAEIGLRLDKNFTIIKQWKQFHLVDNIWHEKTDYKSNLITICWTVLYFTLLINNITIQCHWSAPNTQWNPPDRQCQLSCLYLLCFLSCFFLSFSALSFMIHCNASQFNFSILRSLPFLFLLLFLFLTPLFPLQTPRGSSFTEITWPSALSVSSPRPRCPHTPSLHFKTSPDRSECRFPQGGASLTGRHSTLHRSYSTQV